MSSKLVNVEKNVEIAEEYLKKENNREIFFAKFNKSCLITYVGIAFGILSMYFAFTKMVFSSQGRIRYALSCLIVAGVCDMFDGKFARTCKRTEEEKEFGVQLDSLADTICFIVAPVVIMLSLELVRWYYVIVYIIYSICGISRLGYFNIKADLDTAVKTYRGLPVTSVAIIYPVIAMLHLTIIPFKYLSLIYIIATFLIAILFVVNIKIPKLKGIAYIIVPILATIGIVLLMVIGK